MSTLVHIAFLSLRYRLGSVVLTVVAVGISVFVLLGVEHVRREARDSFASTVSGVDLIVGARTSEINLLLLSVFRIGNATADVSWPAVERIADRDHVSWVVPMSLGDSHRGFRVVGTRSNFFERYKYGRGQHLDFRVGSPFDTKSDVVLGSQVARALDYDLGHSLILSHGISRTSFQQHDQLPFNVVGILSATGTPVDNALFVGLDAIAAIHGEEHEEVHEEVHEEGHEEGHDKALQTPGSVTALLVGLDVPFATLQVQRWVNDYEEEALLAILPGVALAQLWRLVASVEATLRGVSVLVFIASLLGLNAMLLASMRERRGEIDILRSIGAPSVFILGLLMLEALLIVTLGVALAIAALFITVALVNGVLAEEIGMTLSWQVFGRDSLVALALIYLTATLLAMVPAWRAYRLSRVVGAPSG